jgi:hypothetical protein
MVFIGVFKFYCQLCYSLVATCNLMYSASPDDGALRPKHVVKIKTCVVFAHK